MADSEIDEDVDLYCEDCTHWRPATFSNGVQSKMAGSCALLGDDAVEGNVRMAWSYCEKWSDSARDGNDA